MSGGPEDLCDQSDWTRGALAMTTENRMREAPSDHEIERMLIDLGISLGASGMGPGFGHARSVVHETLKRWGSPESLSPPARRTEYEWEHEGLKYRCAWGHGWTTYVWNARLEMWAWVSGGGQSAAIATLANLTPPEEKA